MDIPNLQSEERQTKLQFQRDLLLKKRQRKYAHQVLSLQEKSLNASIEIHPPIFNFQSKINKHNEDSKKAFTTYAYNGPQTYHLGNPDLLVSSPVQVLRIVPETLKNEASNTQFPTSPKSPDHNSQASLTKEQTKHTLNSPIRPTKLPLPNKNEKEQQLFDLDTKKKLSNQVDNTFDLSDTGNISAFTKLTSNNLMEPELETFNNIEYQNHELKQKELDIQDISTKLDNMISKGEKNISLGNDSETISEAAIEPYPNDLPDLIRSSSASENITQFEFGKDKQAHSQINRASSSTNITESHSNTLLGNQNSPSSSLLPKPHRKDSSKKKKQTKKSDSVHRKNKGEIRKEVQFSDENLFIVTESISTDFKDLKNKISETNTSNSCFDNADDICSGFNELNANKWIKPELIKEVKLLGEKSATTLLVKPKQKPKDLDLNFSETFQFQLTPDIYKCNKTNTEHRSEKTNVCNIYDPPCDSDKYILSPAPQGVTVNCRISRDKQGMERGLFPTYFLHLERNDGRRFFLLAARRRRRSTTSNYVISLDATDLSRSSARIVGKLRANFLGTNFTLYDTGKMASLYSSQSENLSVSDSPKFPREVVDSQTQEADVLLSYKMKEISAIIYDPNILGFKGPRKMTVIIPKMNADLQRITLNGDNDSTILIDNLKKRKLQSIMELRNKTPVWNEDTQSYVLNFHGRVTQASVKNFQIVQKNDESNVLMQFGRVSEDVFNLDFNYPLCALQAFGIALSSFDGKLACE